VNRLRKGKNNSIVPVNERILSQKMERNGYMRTHLSRDGISQSLTVHRLVAEAFVPNPYQYTTVNHKDENKQNNYFNNLEWCNMSYQNSYGIGAENRNNAKKVKVVQYDLDMNFIKVWDSIQEVCEAHSLNRSSVTAVCRHRKRYKSTGGFKFRYYKEGMIL